MAESDSMECSREEILRWKKGRQRLTNRHSPTCKKCELKTEAQGLSINVHEWPLPSEENEAKTAVFELRVPAAIYWWRDITYQLLADIFTPELENRDTSDKYKLADFKGLEKWRVTDVGRVQLASKTVSFSIFIF